MRTCAGHYSYHNRVLGAVVVKPRTRGVRDQSGITGYPFHGLRSAIECIRETGGYGVVAYRVWSNNWVLMWHHEGGKSWDFGVAQFGCCRSETTSSTTGETVSTATQPPLFG